MRRFDGDDVRKVRNVGRVKAEQIYPDLVWKNDVDTTIMMHQILPLGAIVRDRRKTSSTVQEC